MIVSLRHLLGWMVSTFRSREHLVLENLALRQQLLALHAQRPRRRMTALHKLFWVALQTFWSGWRKPLILVTPRTAAAPSCPQRCDGSPRCCSSDDPCRLFCDCCCAETCRLQSARTLVSKGRYLVSTLPFLHRAALKTNGLTMQISAKKPKNLRNCESSANFRSWPILIQLSTLESVEVIERSPPQTARLAAVLPPA